MRPASTLERSRISLTVAPVAVNCHVIRIGTAVVRSLTWGLNGLDGRAQPFHAVIVSAIKDFPGAPDAPASLPRTL
jgi:hypothetical protein